MRLSLYVAAAAISVFTLSAQAQTSRTSPNAVQKQTKLPTKLLTSSSMPGTSGAPHSSFLVGGSDNCANAAANDAITGPGTFSCNASGATSGSPIASCGAMGLDVWFYWTSTGTGNVTVSACGGFTNDTVFAVWNDGSPAGSCPTTQIVCNDDTCGLQSQVTFAAVNGAKYFIEIGSFASGSTSTGSFTISTPAPPTPQDDCSLPSAISGLGTFPVNTAGATDSPQQTGFCTTAHADVWFVWTSPVTGPVRVSLCAGVSADTVIAAYPGSACPTAGSQLDCNDDFCYGFGPSQIAFSATNGSQYMLQMGNYAAGVTYSGTFTIDQPPPPPGNDDCAAPVAISGAGPFSFDTTQATTGSQGQTSGACLAYGTTGIDHDLWFTWTAPSTGLVSLSLCAGTTGLDTKVGVYDGSGCPANPAIACNDDSCGLVSQTCFNAVGGQAYTLQIGAYPGALGGTGSFTLTTVTPPTGCTIDDGGSENSVGWTAGGTFVWLNRFGSPTSTTTVSNLLGCYGTPLYPGFTPPAGTAVTYAVWSNPANDGDANNTTLVAQVNTTVAAASIDSDVFQVVPLSTPVTLNGYFFIGIALTHAAGQYVGTLDQSGTNPCGGSLSWYCGVNSGTVNLTNLSSNQYPPATIDSAGIPGIWLVRGDCNGSTGSAYCFGDGTGLACPCTNGAAGNGCPNSVNAAGANLAATGGASVANDTVVLHGIGMPTSSALYFQGTSQIAVVFGDGLRCAGGAVIRLGIKFNSGTGTSQYPDPGDQSVSQRGLIPAAGGTRDYQIWYRNGAAYCTAATFNLSNGLQIIWVP